MYIDYKAVNFINCKDLPKVVPYTGKKSPIPPKNKENVTFRWATDVSFFTITGDKFVIYVPVRRYGDFNTLQ